MKQIITQPPLPGLAAGRELRDAGRERADGHWLFGARLTAALIVEDKGWVTTDDLQHALKKPRHVNHWGSVLRAPWFYKGSEVQSRRPEAHARWIHRWHLTAKGKEELT